MARIPRLGADHLLIGVSVLGLGASVFNYVWIGNGIHGSIGALLVIISTLLMALAAGAVLIAKGRTRSVLGALILLDILGTGFAAYMLEAGILLGLMALALIVWLWGVLAGGRSSRTVGAPLDATS